MLQAGVLCAFRVAATRGVILQGRYNGSTEGGGASGVASLSITGDY